jgi:aryl-phospho-beta-D-glucosidase BglC (GH1 family)
LRRNWYGPNLYDTNVVGGLEHQPLDVLTANIKDLGFNCIRLPFTVEQALEDPAVPLHSALPKTPLAANPQLLGLSSMEVFDATVQSLTDAGLMIILNVHTSASVWCCQLSSYEGWWETPEWTLSQFEQSLVELTQRYERGACEGGGGGCYTMLRCALALRLSGRRARAKWRREGCCASPKNALALRQAGWRARARRRFR